MLCVKGAPYSHQGTSGLPEELDPHAGTQLPRKPLDSSSSTLQQVRLQDGKITFIPNVLPTRILEQLPAVRTASQVNEPASDIKSTISNPSAIKLKLYRQQIRPVFWLGSVERSSPTFTTVAGTALKFAVMVKSIDKGARSRRSKATLHMPRKTFTSSAVLFPVLLRSYPKQFRQEPSRLVKP